MPILLFVVKPAPSSNWGFTVDARLRDRSVVRLAFSTVFRSVQHRLGKVVEVPITGLPTRWNLIAIDVPAALEVGSGGSIKATSVMAIHAININCTCTIRGVWALPYAPCASRLPSDLGLPTPKARSWHDYYTMHWVPGVHPAAARQGCKALFPPLAKQASSANAWSAQPALSWVQAPASAAVQPARVQQARATQPKLSPESLAKKLGIDLPQLPEPLPVARRPRTAPQLTAGSHPTGATHTPVPSSLHDVEPAQYPHMLHEDRPLPSTAAGRRYDAALAEQAAARAAHIPQEQLAHREVAPSPEFARHGMSMISPASEAHTRLPGPSPHMDASATVRQLDISNAASALPADVSGDTVEALVAAAASGDGASCLLQSSLLVGLSANMPGPVAWTPSGSHMVYASGPALVMKRMMRPVPVVSSSDAAASRDTDGDDDAGPVPAAGATFLSGASKRDEATGQIVLSGHGGTIAGFDIAQDGSVIASAANTPDGPEIFLWCAASGRRLAGLRKFAATGQGAGYTGLVFPPPTAWLLAHERLEVHASGDAPAEHVHIGGAGTQRHPQPAFRTGQPAAPARQASRAAGAAGHVLPGTVSVHPSGKWLAVATRDKAARIVLLAWDITAVRDVALGLSAAERGVQQEWQVPTAGGPTSDPWHALDLLYQQPASAVRMLARQVSEYDIARLALVPWANEPALVTVGRENIRCWRVTRGHMMGAPVPLNSYARGATFCDLAFEGSARATAVFGAAGDYSSGASSDGLGAPHRVLVCSSTGCVMQVRWDTRALEAVYHVSDEGLTTLDVNEAMAVTGCADGSLRVWPLDFRAPLISVAAGAREAWLGAAMSPDGLQIATVTDSGGLGLLDIPAQSHDIQACAHADATIAMATPVPPVLRGADTLQSVTLASTADVVATASAGGSIRVWQGAERVSICEFALGGPGDAATALAWSPAVLSCGEEELDELPLLAAGFASGWVRVLDPRTAAVVAEWKQHNAPVGSLGWSVTEAGHSLLSLGRDGMLVVYDGESGFAPQRVVSTPLPPALDSMAPDQLLRIALQPPASGSSQEYHPAQRRWTGSAAADIAQLSVSPDGSMAAIAVQWIDGSNHVCAEAGSGNAVQLLQASGWAPVQKLRLSEPSAGLYSDDLGYDAVTAICWSADGKSVYFGTARGHVLKWFVQGAVLTRAVRHVHSPTRSMLPAVPVGAAHTPAELAVACAARCAQGVLAVAETAGAALLSVGADGSVSVWDAGMTGTRHSSPLRTVLTPGLGQMSLGTISVGVPSVLLAMASGGLEGMHSSGVWAEVRLRLGQRAFIGVPALDAGSLLESEQSQRSAAALAVTAHGHHSEPAAPDCRTSSCSASPASTVSSESSDDQPAEAPLGTHSPAGRYMVIPPTPALTIPPATPSTQRFVQGSSSSSSAPVELELSPSPARRPASQQHHPDEELTSPLATPTQSRARHLHHSPSTPNLHSDKTYARAPAALTAASPPPPQRSPALPARAAKAQPARQSAKPPAVPDRKGSAPSSHLTKLRQRSKGSRGSFSRAARQRLRKSSPSVESATPASVTSSALDMEARIVPIDSWATAAVGIVGSAGESDWDAYSTDASSMAGGGARVAPAEAIESGSLRGYIGVAAAHGLDTEEDSDHRSTACSEDTWGDSSVDTRVARRVARQLLPTPAEPAIALPPPRLEKSTQFPDASESHAAASTAAQASHSWAEQAWRQVFKSAHQEPVRVKQPLQVDTSPLQPSSPVASPAPALPAAALLQRVPLPLANVEATGGAHVQPRTRGSPAQGRSVKTSTPTQAARTAKRVKRAKPAKGKSAKSKKAAGKRSDDKQIVVRRRKRAASKACPG